MYAISTLMVISLIIYVIFSVKEAIQDNIENKKLKTQVERYKEAAEKIEETIKKANDEKKKLNTDNPDNDIDNATDIMSDISNKISKSRISSSARPKKHS